MKAHCCSAAPCRHLHTVGTAPQAQHEVFGCSCVEFATYPQRCHPCMLLLHLATISRRIQAEIEYQQTSLTVCKAQGQIVYLGLLTIHSLNLNENIYDTKDIRQCKMSHHFKQQHSHTSVCRYIRYNRESKMRLLYRSLTHDLKGHAMKETSIRRAS